MYKSVTWRTIVPFVVFGLIVVSNPQSLAQHWFALAVFLLAIWYGWPRAVCPNCGDRKYFHGKISGQIHCSNCFPHDVITLPDERSDPQ